MSTTEDGSAACRVGAFRVLRLLFGRGWLQSSGEIIDGFVRHTAGNGIELVVVQGSAGEWNLLWTDRIPDLLRHGILHHGCGALDVADLYADHCDVRHTMLYPGRKAQEGSMTVLIYVNTNKQVGDANHLKVFANVDAAEKWLAENDPEGVAFEYPVEEWTASRAKGR
jgi:hypothetical protein